MEGCMTTVYQDKLPPLGFFGIDLRKGSHDARERGVCALEAVAWLAGEPHSDKPRCACPVIGAFVIAWNDALPTDEDRNRLLKPLIPRLVGSRSTKAVEKQRSYLALDWLIRVQTPAWLELRDDLKPHAAALRSLDAIRDMATARAAGPFVIAARDSASAAWAAAWDAARAAAGDAAGDAAWDAARASARAAAGDAARDAARASARAAAWDAARASARAAAWDAALAAARASARAAAWDAARASARAAAWDAALAAARAAAGDAAGDAARAAAWAAARDALKPTVAQLQASALDLIDRMLSVTA